jgi:hypothetical protein
VACWTMPQGDEAPTVGALMGVMVKLLTPSS